MSRLPSELLGDRRVTSICLAHIIGPIYHDSPLQIPERCTSIDEERHRGNECFHDCMLSICGAFIRIMFLVYVFRCLDLLDRLRHCLVCGFLLRSQLPRLSSASMSFRAVCLPGNIGAHSLLTQCRWKRCFLTRSKHRLHAGDREWPNP